MVPGSSGQDPLLKNVRPINSTNYLYVSGTVAQTDDPNPPITSTSSSHSTCFMTTTDHKRVQPAALAPVLLAGPSTVQTSSSTMSSDLRGLVVGGEVSTASACLSISKPGPTKGSCHVSSTSVSETNFGHVPKLPAFSHTSINHH